MQHCSNKILFPNDSVTCIAPWYELRIESNGNLSYCHASSIDQEASKLSLIDWFNYGPQPTQVRSNIQQGVPSSGCQRCYQTESKSIISARQRRNQQGAIYNNKYFYNSLEQSPAWPRISGQTSTFKPAFLHISLSNLCNLSCKMCEPALSSQLANTMKKIKLIDASTPTLVDWTDDPERWDQFCNLVIDNPELICLHFMGGEPLIHKKFHKFIDLCIEKQCTNFHLTFVTNGTFYNPDLLKKLSYFKSATIEISLENLHSSNDYIRQGSSYKYIKQNILEFVKHRNQKINVVLRSVPQALSVMHYETLIDFAIKNQLQIDSNDLENKPNLKAFVLPEHIKKSLIDKFRQKYLDRQDEALTTSDRVLLLRNQSAVVEQIQDHVRNVIKILAEPEPSNIEDLRRDFIKYCQYFDKDSSHFLSVYPELEKFYYEYN